MNVLVNTVQSSNPYTILYVLCIFLRFGAYVWGFNINVVFWTGPFFAVDKWNITLPRTVWILLHMALTNTVVKCVSHSICVTLFSKPPCRFGIQIKANFISAFSWHSARFSLKHSIQTPVSTKSSIPSVIKSSRIISCMNGRTWVFEYGFILPSIESPAELSFSYRTSLRNNSLVMTVFFNFPFVFGPLYKYYLLSDQDKWPGRSI
jgi:hypothetical protein